MAEKEYYLSHFDKGLVYYKSDIYKLSECELLALIKICIVERRNVKIGKKILAVYRDSTADRIALSEQKLKSYGVKINDEKPEFKRKANGK